MKRLNKLTVRLLALNAALALGTTFAAPPSPTVYQRTDNTESIELSNIEDAGTEQRPVALEPSATVGSAGASAKTTATASYKVAPQKTKKKVLKKVTKPDGTVEEQWVENDEESDGSDTSDGTSADSGSRSSDASTNGAGVTNSGSATPQNAGSSYFGGASSGASGYSGASGSSSTTSSTGVGNTSTPSSSGSTSAANSGSTSTGSANTGSSTAPVAGNSTDTSTVSSASNNTGTASTTGPSTVPGTGTTTAGGTTTPGATSALQTKLESYRDMMLTDVTKAQVTNPAITRRYQMMDRTTFQATVGK